MKRFLLLILTLSFTSSVMAETLRSKVIADLIGAHVENSDIWSWSDSDAVENLGSIWVTRYTSTGEGDDIEEGHPGYYSFVVLRSEDYDKNGAADWMNVTVDVPCGTEYDESELSGTCDVNVKKYTSGWKVTKASCECDSGNY